MTTNKDITSPDIDMRLKKLERMIDKLLSTSETKEESAINTIVRDKPLLESKKLNTMLDRQYVGQIIEEKFDQLINDVLPKLLPAVIDEFNEKTKESLSVQLDRIKTAASLSHEITKDTTEAVSAFKSAYTIKKFAISGAFCLGVLISSVTMFYCFPQIQNIHHGINQDMLTNYFAGKAIRDHLDKLSPKDRKMIEDRYQKHIKD